MEAITLGHLHSMADAMVRTCDNIVLVIRNIKDQWHDAPYFLTSIMESCQRIFSTTSQFRDCLAGELGLRLDVLHSMLASFQKDLNWVEKCVKEIQPRGNDAADRTLWKRFRLEVHGSTLKNCSNELDKQNSSIQSLADILKLFQQQAMEAISVSSLGWLAAISLVCGVTCALMIPDARIKDSLQASIATLTLSGAWVISLMKGLAKEFVTTLWALIKLVLDLLSSIAELLTSSQIQWAGWFSGFKPKVFCFRPPGASHIPKSASREELSVALLEAAASGSLRDAAALLKRGARCTVRDENLMTPLHLAASWGHCAIVKLLLSYKNKDWFAQGGITPIHLAARYGHSKVVKLLISNGGHDWINDRADSPETLQKFKFPRIISHGKTFSARELAAVYGHENAVLTFPSTKKDDILHAMSSACALGNQSMVETIWRHHKQRSYFKRHSNPTNLVSTFQAPPLHLAVTSKNPALVAYLLERGFPVNDQATAEGPQYSSPAHYAAMTGSAEILYLLKSSGA
ncbi:Pfs NACHT ankyrin domain-containing protein [Fusarium phyllophilum]|uniref:Pfs NACHT ankyrin domain-containing protein n=1 Tax=Fusarium phyllophilum TaxID=47803 RepID=A0A8H5MZD8_9HYPO|nr:Pfs NACHT ankyrin domain-containing protein [Fusarium phyllophilum]